LFFVFLSKLQRNIYVAGRNMLSTSLFCWSYSRYTKECTLYPISI